MTKEDLIKAIKEGKAKNLEGANLEGAYLYCANLYCSNLEDAYLKNTYLKGANLKGANLKGVNLEGAKLPEGSKNPWIIKENQKRKISLDSSVIEKKDDVKNMSKKTLVQRNVDSMNEAAFLMAAMKTQDLSQKGMLEIVKHMGLSDDERRGIEKLMGNEFFACLLGLGIGNAIEYIPGAEDKPQVGKLAGKMREFAFAKAGVTAIDGLFEKFAPNMMGILGQMNQVVESLPEVPAKVRVADSGNDDVDVEFEEEENIKSNVASLRVANGRNRLDK